MNTIKFGTDGWRALIAREFTFENVSRVAQAAAKVMKAKLPGRTHMVVGYDRRFLSKDFAKCVAMVLAREGYQVMVSQEAIPTPAFSWCAKNYKNMAGAVVITASHNPPEWNGFKFKETFGGSASLETTKAFEEQIQKTRGEEVYIPSPEEFSHFIEQHKIKEVHVMPEYAQALKTQVDTGLIEKAGFKVAIDTMYGSGTHHLKHLFESIGVEVLSMHDHDNPGFEGVPPEPIEKNLGQLSRLVTASGCHAGFATDGDADRLGAIDEKGGYFSTQKILSVVYWHMLKNRHKPWSIAKSVSTTNMVDLIAKKFGQQCYETPVGFKYIAEKIVEGKAHMGGEESGGIGIVDHIPERDSFLTALLLLEMMAKTKKSLGAIYHDLCQDFRPYEFVRVDLHVSRDVMQRAMEKLQKFPPKEWNGREVAALIKTDGFKFMMQDGSWLLVRPSGTEPIFRLYVEAETLNACQSMVEAARTYVVQA